MYNKGLPHKTIAAGVPVFGTNDKKEKHCTSAEAKRTLWTKSDAAVGMLFALQGFPYEPAE